MSIVKKIIKTSDTFQPTVPFSQAVLIDHTLYASGCVGMDNITKKIVEGGIENETRQALINLGYVLKAAGTNYENVVKITILLTNINHFSIVNSVYKEYFTKSFPARTTFQVSKLPLGAEIEIEAIALVGEIKSITA